MRPLSKLVALVGVIVLSIAWVSGQIGAAVAQEEPKTAKSARGGLLTKTAHNQFETFFYQTGVRVFVQDHSGAAVNATKLSATATFYHPNSPKPWFSRPLGGTKPSLVLAIGLANAPQSGAKATFEISGLPESGTSTVTFTVPVEFVSIPAESTLAAPPTSTPASPRYVYGPGYYGFGYYKYPGPEVTPAVGNAPTVYGYSTPSRRSSGGSSGTHDWSTGRDLPSGGLISKPWLRPMD